MCTKFVGMTFMVSEILLLLFFFNLPNFPFGPWTIVNGVK